MGHQCRTTTTRSSDYLTIKYDKIHNNDYNRKYNKLVKCIHFQLYNK